MTTKSQKKLQKRIARTQFKKSIITQNRLAKHAQERQEKEDFKKEKEHRKLIRQIDLMKEQYESVKEGMSPEMREQIERNIEVLVALEDEHEHEAEKRRVLNTELEEKGAFSLKEKLDVLNKECKKEGAEAESEEPWEPKSFESFKDEYIHSEKEF